jgi:hypothetical protein
MSEDPAKAHFYLIAVHRFLGAGLVLLGILVNQGMVDWPQEVGWALIALGLFDVFVTPRLLARMWRTPK